MLDGQGCLLPVRHFHREDTPHTPSSCTSLYNTCRAESSAESNPNPSAYPPRSKSDVAFPCSLDASESNCAEFGSLDPSKSVGFRCFPVSLAKIDATQAHDSYGDLAEEIAVPSIRAEFDCSSTSHSNCFSPSQEVETGACSAYGEFDEMDTNFGMCRSVQEEVSYEQVASEMRVDFEEARNSTGEEKTVVKRGEEGSTGGTDISEDLCKWKYAVVSEDKELSRVDAEHYSPGSGFTTASSKDSKEAEEGSAQSGCTEENARDTQLVYVNITCDTGCKRSRVTMSSAALGQSKSLCAHRKVPSDPQDDHTDDQQPFLPGLDNESALRCFAFIPLSDLGRLAMLGRQYRDLVRSRLIFQLRQMYGMVEHLVFIYTSRVEVWTAYDARRNAWRILPPANASLDFMSSDKESLSAGTHVLWLGKEVFEFVYYRYDLLTNSWERGPSMVNPRCLFASASCGEFAYVAGGFGPANNIGALSLLNSAERYNSVTGIWERLPPMSTPRHKCAGFFMDGKFYVIGGRDANHQPIMSGEEYNPITGSWRLIPDMYFAPEVTRQDMLEPSPPLVAAVNNQLYAVENTTNTLKMYNKHKNTWSNLGLLPVRADLRNGWGVAFKALGDRLFVMGESSEGIAVCCWRPGPNARASDWDCLDQTERGVGCFLYNCAVMAC